jgi:hypothetical protein
MKQSIHGKIIFHGCFVSKEKERKQVTDNNKLKKLSQSPELVTVLNSIVKCLLKKWKQKICFHGCFISHETKDRHDKLQYFQHKLVLS